MGASNSKGDAVQAFEKMPVEEKLKFILIAVVIKMHKKDIEKLEKIEKESAELFILMLLLATIDKYMDAIVLGDLIILKQQFIPVYLLKSICYLKLQMIENAEKCLLEAQKVKPNCTRVFYLSTKICLIKEDYPGALKNLCEIEKKKPGPNVDYSFGIVYQKMNVHRQAIQYFEKAHTALQKKKYFIAKMESFVALENYDEALECCDIAISLKPGKKELYERKANLLKLLGNEEESEKVRILGLHQDENYTLKIFEEKRKLDEHRSQLIQKQSKIKLKSEIKQTQSQIILNKQNQQIVFYLDALYFTFTYFCALYYNPSLDCTNLIAKYLSTQERIKSLNFTDMVRITIQSCYPDLKDLDISKISDRLKIWYEKKIKNQNEDSMMFSNLFNIFKNLTNTYVRQILIERLNEDFHKSFERQNKNKDFYTYITAICQQFEQQGYTIYRQPGSVLGLEHAILILGFMIKFIALADDKEDFEVLIYRGIKQGDFSQYQQSQSKLKSKTQNITKTDEEDQALQNLSDSQKQMLESGQIYNSAFLSKFG
ncbi:unnamed protein product [Paramecium sonneborni]|uniref:Tetratricopeptide repeat protein n=1 Tax=Paramecium sonneborni TaxID=65129 RepID=A0A8S1KIV8_9CILI|nr:unnamed protein product [Paramecium sonneborni]